MPHIHLNLKRFDILPDYGGVNRISPPAEWGKVIVKKIADHLSRFSQEHSDYQFTIYLPEAHLISALSVEQNQLEIGCQSVYRQDTQKGGNFGAFTTHRTANSMSQLGVTSTIIGHLEERLDKKGILSQVGVNQFESIDSLLNQEILVAQKSGMKVLYCIGETEDERNNWQTILEGQLKRGLKDVDLKNIIIAYEPVWAIGPGKIPPSSNEVEEVVNFIKSIYPKLPVIYGGGLKQDNAETLSSIPSLDGGLIALTRFSGDIGFYPEDYIEIVELFARAKSK